MRDLRYLDWPFFEDAHRELARELDQWGAQHLHDIDHDDADASCTALVRSLGAGGWLRWSVPKAWGGALDTIESRSLCLIRETLAYHDGLADFSFAMQGLGSGVISMAGTDGQRQRYLPDVSRGAKIAAFALSEPDAGSDVAAMKTSARRVHDAQGDAWLLNGSKTWISNGGIADFYVVFARTGEQPGAKGISAFVVDADAPGLSIDERIEVVAPHPLATLGFRDCRVSADALLGEENQGFKLAMGNLDIFRASVAGAALGMARRALAEALARAQSRQMFRQTLADFQMTQAALADMATEIDAAALLTYRAAWLRDVRGERTTLEAAMAKMTATEHAQRVIDRAVQIFGGLGVKRGHIIESLYREIRALRIYEGATEVQKLIIARELLKGG